MGRGTAWPMSAMVFQDGEVVITSRQSAILQVLSENLENTVEGYVLKIIDEECLK